MSEIILIHVEQMVKLAHLYIVPITAAVERLMSGASAMQKGSGWECAPLKDPASDVNESAC